MRKLNVLVLFVLVVSGSSLAGDRTAAESWHHDDLAARLSDSHCSMFDGVSLTEQQRQQMRDLMSQARLRAPAENVSEIERLHSLVTAENFDEPAVRAQTEKIAQEQVVRQVELAKVRNQMYNLLTPEQRQILNQRHQQRIADIKSQSSGVIQTSAQKPVLSYE